VADIPSDGNIRVTFCTSIANKAAPTVAELNAGIQLQSTASAEGLSGWQPETASIANRKLDSTFNSSDVGSISIEDPMMEFFKQDGTDTIYNTMSKGTPGFIVIRRSIPSGTAWASTQKLVGTFPVKCGQRRWVDTEENSMERWQMPFKITAEPAFDSVVA
jgi:hypothetical protein